MDTTRRVRRYRRLRRAAVSLACVVAFARASTVARAHDVERMVPRAFVLARAHDVHRARACDDEITIHARQGRGIARGADWM